MFLIFKRIRLLSFGIKTVGKCSIDLRFNVYELYLKFLWIFYLVKSIVASCIDGSVGVLMPVLIKRFKWVSWYLLVLYERWGCLIYEYAEHGKPTSGTK